MDTDTPQELNNTSVETPKPEVLANHANPNTRLLFSIPICRELDNGYLTRSMTAMLSQKIPQGTSLEVNYVLNYGHNAVPFFNNKEKALEDPSLRSLYEETDKTRELMKKIVKIQSMAQDPGIRDQLTAYINEEHDPVRRDLFQMAADRANQVAISAVDATPVKIWREGYAQGSEIAGYRTIGMDYAYRRLPEDGIFFMYDVDTVPANNSFVSNVLTLYDQNPDKDSIFANIAFQTPGLTKDLVADSGNYSIARVTGYNTFPSSSPQISFRKRSMNQLKAITTGIEMYEDYETARRLVVFEHQKRLPEELRELVGDDKFYELLRAYGDISEGQLFNNPQFHVPTSLISDREGFVDGAGRLSKLQKEGISPFASVLDEATQRVNYLKSRLDELEEPLKSQALEDLKIYKQKLKHQQKVFLQFNRKAVKTVREMMTNGTITKIDSTIAVDWPKVLAHPFGRSIGHYLQMNSHIIAELTPEDLKIIDYFTGISPIFPQEIRELTPFQVALRDYVGEYPEEDLDMDGLQKIADYQTDHLDDRRTILQPFVVEALAYGEIEKKYNVYRTGNQFERKPNIDTTFDLETRSQWAINYTPIKLEEKPAAVHKKSLLDFLKNLLSRDKKYP